MPGGLVYFAYFWHAFSGAVRDVLRPGAACEKELVRGALDRELDAFREDVLEVLGERAAVSGRWVLPAATLLHLLEAAAATSVVASFWRSLGSLAVVARDSAGELSLLDVSSAMLVCLRRALELLRGPARASRPRQLPSLDREGAATRREPGSGAGTPVADSTPGSRRVSAKPAPAAGPPGTGLVVHLNIYDVSHHESVHFFNAVFAHWLAPVKLGGAFHAGVEVHGLEWSFGATRRETLPGIACIMPRQDPQHKFRQSVLLGTTRLSAEGVGKVIAELLEDYPGNSYDVLRRNCCHFAEDFCRRLGVGPIPAWVHRLARFGAGADGAIQALLGSSAGELLPLASCHSLSGYRDEGLSCLAAAELLPQGEEGAGPGPL